MNVDEQLVTVPFAIQLAKERLSPFQCGWTLKRSDRTAGGPCKITLNSWHTLRLHTLKAHCRLGEIECKLPGCNLLIKVMRDTEELREHILTGHLNNLKLPCPIKSCTNVLRETRLGHHFQSEHGDFLDQPFSQLQVQLQSIHPYTLVIPPLTPLPPTTIPVFATRNLPLYPHPKHVQLPEEVESSESEVDEEMLQLTLGIEDCRIEFQMKSPVAEAEFLSMPFDPHGRIPSTKWPPEKSIGYEAFAKKMAKLHPKPEKPAEQPQRPDEDQVQIQIREEPPASSSSMPFSTRQYARKTGIPASGSARATRVRGSKTA
ncbi:hypothetical protein BJ322DRAFT_706858 [Thelephora terrestris]|uniref:C2H2-type domain-containing protein n=1 Tax=Thelephora terrestris TaxID=56493 RepID=A0A9P6HI48_9AGAM|nr:hypothetical protein BJ322DRAFT_706858 [Thelephora terrestris]